MDEVVLVDKHDKKLGLMGKLEAHQNGGQLHRAFVAFVLDEKGRILLSKRSKFKPLWPLFWENTSSSHPRSDESYEQAGERRLREELGFTTPLRFLFKFTYQADYNEELSEHEVCAVLVGKYSGDVSPDPKEIADNRWVTFKKLKKEILHDPSTFAPWLIFAIEELNNDSILLQHLSS